MAENAKRDVITYHFNLRREHERRRRQARRHELEPKNEFLTDLTLDIYDLPLNGNGDDGLDTLSTPTNMMLDGDGTLADSSGGRGDKEHSARRLYDVFFDREGGDDSRRAWAKGGAHGTAACYVAYGVSVRWGKWRRGCNYELHSGMAGKSPHPCSPPFYAVSSTFNVAAADSEIRQKAWGMMLSSNARDASAVFSVSRDLGLTTLRIALNGDGANYSSLSTSSSPSYKTSFDFDGWRTLRERGTGALMSCGRVSCEAEMRGGGESGGQRNDELQVEKPLVVVAFNLQHSPSPSRTFSFDERPLVLAVLPGMRRGLRPEDAEDSLEGCGANRFEGPYESAPMLSLVHVNAGIVQDRRLLHYQRPISVEVSSGEEACSLQWPEWRRILDDELRPAFAPLHFSDVVHNVLEVESLAPTRCLRGFSQRRMGELWSTLAAKSNGESGGMGLRGCVNREGKCQPE
ncbi:hypothetical protein NLJ89_g11442 [Agrocybe chaxingu]|uniref:Uncharacterized protein n=1 Tax=Agrocybe chaxingu TaxID=84603 RepID=A0A9W8MQ04_9AGAR|nr:hypothetical protein NLJ89_g11442 [Agrocybe chaxingu]